MTPALRSEASSLRDCSGLVAVVTGTSRGIGRATARLLAERGARVLGCSSQPSEPIDGVEQIMVDLAVPGAVETLMERSLAIAGSVDCWVNNAGRLAPIGALAEVDTEEVRKAIEVNVQAVVRATSLFAAHVASRPGAGVLINLSSGAGSTPYEGWAHYCAAKAFVDMLTEVVAREGAASGLRAHSVAPGVVDTEMQRLIRATPSSVFPAQPRFVARYEAGELKSAEEAARQIVDLVMDPGDVPVVLRLP
ncbi:MAG: SDR family NAD(P)-dependent oxidoreductase [Actinomycetes bacterium]